MRPQHRGKGQLAAATDGCFWRDCVRSYCPSDAKRLPARFSRKEGKMPIVANQQAPMLPGRQSIRSRGARACSRAHATVLLPFSSLRFFSPHSPTLLFLFLSPSLFRVLFAFVSSASRLFSFDCCCFFVLLASSLFACLSAYSASVPANNRILVGSLLFDLFFQHLKPPSLLPFEYQPTTHFCGTPQNMHST